MRQNESVLLLPLSLLLDWERVPNKDRTFEMSAGLRKKESSKLDEW